ncbi:MAG: trypsin-like peptidase domain-containing protein [Thermomicrobiales bacterium]
MTASIPLPFTGDAAVSIAEQVLPSVVQVDDGGRGSGAGVVIGPRGIIVTNAHVVRRRSAVVRQGDGTRFEGPVVARDDSLDLAAIKIDAGVLPALESGDSQTLRPGQLVLTVGHPLGLQDVVTIGVISRPPSKDDPRELIASNVTLNRGNSGGPLLDASGRLIGINAMVAGPGLGLSIPVHVVRRFLARQVDPRPHIGITAQQINAGLILTDVQPESPADAAGLLPGDVLISVGAVQVESANVLIDSLIAAGIGGSWRWTSTVPGSRIRSWWM